MAAVVAAAAVAAAGDGNGVLAAAAKSVVVVAKVADGRRARGACLQVRNSQCGNRKIFN